MTEIGGSAPVSEARVEAGNWMTALTLARKAIGESGGVPPGASCSVSPDGRVTIQDAIARKTYSLAPDVTTSLSERPPPKGPRVPSESVPRAAVRIPKPSDRPPANSRPPQTTISYDAGALNLREPERPKRTPQKTISYSIGELARAATASAAPGAPAQGSAAQGAPAPDPKPSKQTIAYDAAQLGVAAPQQDPVRPAVDTSAKPKRAPQQTIAYDAAQLGVAAPQQDAVRPAVDTSAKPKRAPRHTIAYDAAQLGVATEAAEAPPAWDLLHSRDEEPSKDSPLLYRERTYVVLQQTNAALAEAILRARFDELRDELADRPKGKLVNMALFDHRWTERPAKPPLATLQWKDWRGEPVVAAASAPQPANASPPGEPANAAESSTPQPAHASTLPAAVQAPPAQGTGSSTPQAADANPPPAAAVPTQATQSSPPPAADASAPAAVVPTQATQSSPPAADASPPPAPAVPTTQSSPPHQAEASPPPAVEQPAPAQTTASSPPHQAADSSAPQAGATEPSSGTPEPERVEEPALAHEPTAPATPVASLRDAPALAHEPTAPATPVASLREAPNPEPALAHEPTVPAAPAVSAEVAPPADELELPIADVAPSRTQAGPDDRLATAFEALQDLFFLTTPLEGLDFVVRLLGDLVPSSAASACLYDINTDEFRFVALTGPGAAERKGEAVPRLAGLFGAAALAGGETLLVEVAGQDERFDPGVDGRVGIDPDTMALVAVSHGGRLLGLLQLINRVDQAQFSRADANLLTYVAEKLGEFLHAARLRPAD